MKIYGHKDYSEYTSAQQSHVKKHIKNMKNKNLTVADGDKVGWAKKSHLDDIYTMIKNYKDLDDIGFILCHGVRCGYESYYFMGKFGAEKVYSTDLVKDAFLFDRKNFYVMDFDDLPEEWTEKFDVIYSNVMDHVRDPEFTLKTWKKELKPGGLMSIVFSCGSKVTDCDCCALSLGNYLEEIRTLSINAGLDLLEYSKLNLNPKGVAGTVNVLFKK